MCILEENSIIFFVKFHHRALALHLIFLFHYLSKRPVPAEFIEMGQKVKVKFRGTLSRVEAASIGYSLSFSLDAGIKLNWIDYVKQSKRGDDSEFSNALRANMLKHCPEHVDKVADWKSLQGHCTRLTTESIDAITSFMEAEAMQTTPVLQSWITPNWLLAKIRGAKAQKTDDNLTEEEQPLAIRRLLVFLKSRAVEEGIAMSEPNFGILLNHETTQLERQGIPKLTNSELDEIAMKNLPVATEVPPMLAQALEREVGSQQTVPKMPMVVTDGILDASAVNPDFKIPAKLEFEDVCPATLALAARCAQDGVFAAPSIMFPGATGLYPATDFKKGDVVARVEPLSHKWVSIDDPSLEEDTGFRRVEIDLEYPSRNCKRMVCVGDPSRHPWANINLVTNDSPAAANLTPKVSAGNMGDDFLVLEAAHDIPAFSAELLWFANVNVSSEPAGAKKDASEPDASKPVQLGVSPQKVAPAPVIRTTWQKWVRRLHN